MIMLLDVSWSEKKKTIVNVELAVKLVNELSKRDSVTDISFKYIPPE